MWWINRVLPPTVWWTLLGDVVEQLQTISGKGLLKLSKKCIVSVVCVRSCECVGSCSFWAQLLMMQLLPISCRMLRRSRYFQWLCSDILLRPLYNLLIELVELNWNLLFRDIQTIQKCNIHALLFFFFEPRTRLLSLHDPTARRWHKENQKIH